MRCAGIATGLIGETLSAAGTIIVGSVITGSSAGCFHCQVNDLRFHIVHAVTFYADLCLPTSSSLVLYLEHYTVNG
jgi:hypothetical protein